jgi:sulfate transport system ATP-binding protein
LAALGLIVPWVLVRYRFLAKRLSQTLTVGPNTRIELKRVSDDSYADVELPREHFTTLRDRLGLAPGVRVRLRPRRVT